MELFFAASDVYRVKSGQTLYKIARAFHVPAPLIARENGLEKEPTAGRILTIPKTRGNAYLVRGGESRTLLCGGPEIFAARNGTSALYPAQTVFL